MRLFAAVALTKNTVHCLYCAFKWAFSVALLLAASVAFSLEVKPFNGTEDGLLLTLEGSNTIGANLAPTWAKAYLEAKGAQGVYQESLLRPNEYRIKGRQGTRIVFIDVHAHGTSTGFEGLAAKTADIALASRPIKSTEAETLKAYGDMTHVNAEHVVGIDGLAVIVHPQSGVSQLRVDQIADIFAGKITNWKALGGSNRPITLYARDDNSGTFDTFSGLVLGKTHTLSAKAQRFESNDQLSDLVSKDLGAIGFVGLASVRQAKALAVSDSNSTALKPEMIYVATEDYPLARRLYMYTRPKVQGLANEFVAFAQSLKGQNIVEQVGFISQNPMSLQLALDGGPAPYVALAQHAKRLSVNFRFQQGRADLDNKALRDVGRLARHMQSSEGALLRVQLIGFSNVEASAKRAQVLSRLRATAVKSALYRYGVPTESVMGFGDDLPVASTQGSSASKNERVEVWVFDEASLSQINVLKSESVNTKAELTASPM